MAICKISKEAQEMAVRRIWLKKRLDRMKSYLELKVDEEDWHGIADAAMDIREIVAEIRCISSII